MFCFLAGTRIATPDGEVAVEALHKGQLVLTAAGAAEPIRWIGFRHLVAAQIKDAPLYAPIVIKKNAIAAGKPARDLWVTPDHAILVENHLIPARLLVNGASIRQVPCAEFRFFHIELDRHDLLLAEGLEAESYIDLAGSRRWFDDNALMPPLRDMETAEQTERAYAQRGRMPLSLKADVVKPIWERLAARGAIFSKLVGVGPVTRDPGLRLTADGVVLHPRHAEAGRYLFAIPDGVTSVTIASRSASPWSNRPWLDDRRQLGVSIGTMRLMGSAGLVQLTLEGGAIGSGWHGVEQDEANGKAWRWTDGAASLHLPKSSGTSWLELHVCGTLDYPIEAASALSMLAG